MNALNCLRRFASDEEGASAVEYAVLLMLILLAVILSVGLLGDSTADSLDDSATQIGGAMNN